MKLRDMCFPFREDLRDLVGDLCERIERSGYNDTNLGLVYVRDDLRIIKDRSARLIDDIISSALEYAEDEIASYKALEYDRQADD